METSARSSSTKTIATVTLSLTTLVLILGFVVTWLVVTNRVLIHEQRTVVTPMTCNAPFVTSEAEIDTEYFRMMMLSFLALRLNVALETVDFNHAFLMTFVEPDVRADFVETLDEEAAQTKANDVNPTLYATEINVYPADGRIDVRSVLKMWIDNSKPSTEIRTYRLRLRYTGGFTRISRFYEVINEKQPSSVIVWYSHDGRCAPGCAGTVTCHDQPSTGRTVSVEYQ